MLLKHFIYLHIIFLCVFGITNVTYGQDCNRTIVEMAYTPTYPDSQPEGYLIKNQSHAQSTTLWLVATQKLPCWSVLPPPDHCIYNCDHSNRQFDWNISGGAYNILATEQLNNHTQRIQVEFQDTTVYTINVEIGQLPGGTCWWPGATHDSEYHAGGATSTELNFWHLLKPLYTNVHPVRGEGVVVSAHLQGSVQALSSAVGIYHPYSWGSKTKFWNRHDTNAPKYNSLTNQWNGIAVTKTTVYCTVTIQNPYKANPNFVYDFMNQKDEAEIEIGVNYRYNFKSPEPTFLSDAEPLWQKDDYGFGFPINNQPTDLAAYLNNPANYYYNNSGWSVYKPDQGFFMAYQAHGQNTNLNIEYRNSIGATNIIYTPIYVDGNDWYQEILFTSMVPNGFNANLWYNISPHLFRIDRISRFNYWVRPESPAPPVLHVPPPNEYLPYWTSPVINFLALQGVHYDNAISCYEPIYPGVFYCLCEHNEYVSCQDYGHSRWEGLVNHEEYGPGWPWPNDHRLGHQARIEHKFANPNSPDDKVDASRECEHHVATSFFTLRYMNELERKACSDNLSEYTKELDQQEGYVLGPEPYNHNWHHREYVYRNTVPRWDNLPATLK